MTHVSTFIPASYLLTLYIVPDIQYLCSIAAGSIGQSLPILFTRLFRFCQISQSLFKSGHQAQRDRSKLLLKLFSVHYLNATMFSVPIFKNMQRCQHLQLQPYHFFLDFFFFNPWAGLWSPWSLRNGVGAYHLDKNDLPCLLTYTHTHMHIVFSLCVLGFSC